MASTQNPYAPATARLNRHGMQRWRSGHPWIYRAGVEYVEEDTGAEGVCEVEDAKGRTVGTALLSRESQITLRILTRNEEAVDRGFLDRRLERAIAYRERVSAGREAMRLVFGEADGLPGLVVDRYGDHLVMQIQAAGMDRLESELVGLLQERLKPESILARNDSAVRTLEGLPRAVTALHGEPPETVTYRENQLRWTVSLRKGQKTGAFLDQAENHRRAGELARGRVLDAFTYHGGFALPMAAAADEVIAVDSSTAALEQANTNASRNGIGNVTFVEANVFDYLKQEDKTRSEYDMVVLDPPAFAKNKRELEGALRGYKEINLRAMKILRPGGTLITCSCSYHLTEPMMEELLASAAADSGRTFRVSERRRQAADHPVRVGFPESLYLKCFILERTE